MVSEQYFMEQVTGIEPVSLPWQGSVIATILYLRITDIIGNDPIQASKFSLSCRILEDDGDKKVGVGIWGNSQGNPKLL